MAKKYDISVLTKSQEISKEDFVLSTSNDPSEEIFTTKKTSYFKQSLKRFMKNKWSFAGFLILIAISLYAIIVPIASPFQRIDRLQYNVDGLMMKELLPKLFDDGGFWDGTDKRTINEVTYNIYKYYDTTSPIKEDYGEKELTKDEAVLYNNQKLYNIRFDSYALGSSIVNLSKDQYYELKKYEDENNLIIILPHVDYSSYLSEYREYLENSSYGYSTNEISYTIENMEKQYSNNSNITYKIEPIFDSTGKIKNNNIFKPKFDENENIIRIYKDPIKDDTSDNVLANIQNEIYSTRVDFAKYFEYKYGFKAKFIFGSNSAGQDLFSRLALGCLFSLSLGLIVTIINFLIGLLYGAIEGYYGGKVDLVMDRIVEIISAIPSTIILVITNVYFASQPNLSSSMAIVIGLVVAFISTGWIGVASRSRTQFYRFKNQEYVLASRSLGASDKRLIFKHILPNALGTLITSTILMVPGVIFSESSLSYLGIIDFSTSNLSSIGQLLSEGSSSLGTPNSCLLLFPCLVISLLMISFNLFGNGLRDAFNTNLRGEK